MFIHSIYGNGYKVSWHVGTHTVNVYDIDGNEIDAFTFGWHVDRPTNAMFTTAASGYLDYLCGR